MSARQQSIPAVLTFITVLLVVAHLFFVSTIPFGARSNAVERPGHDEHLPLHQTGNAGHFNIGLQINERSAVGRPNYVVADIIADEDFILSNGFLWQERIVEMLRGTNELLSDVDVEIQIGSIGTWHSEKPSDSLRDLLESAESQYRRDTSRMLIVLTCEDPPQRDGLAQSDRGRLIVEYYHDDVPRNSALLSHEIGHLFGAGHHEATEECDGEGCLMDERGYRHMTDWCDHHINQIRANVERAVANPELR